MKREAQAPAQRAQEELERDAKRYRWLKKRSPGSVCAIAWLYRSACYFAEPDAAIDAAMKEEAGE